MDNIQNSEEVLALQTKVNDLFVLKRLISSLPNLPDGKLKETIEIQISEYLGHEDIRVNQLIERLSKLDEQIADKESDLHDVLSETKELRERLEESDRIILSRNDSTIKKSLLFVVFIIIYTIILVKTLGAS